MSLNRKDSKFSNILPTKLKLKFLIFQIITKEKNDNVNLKIMDNINYKEKMNNFQQF